ncbi:ABC-2 type transport system ATP-binding protein [Streptosporangium becharense]|uniref:ABC-2 type transport system ATP-binding protein n=1 Tax=Streptosporangium becharense TaxID=1816182 RepID=A0A7W9MK62_9ACTN|nr:ATP-binding cassette domain-containing protein [Streptosporangium becharense]MBB2910545.1 ABC-2 type transport system ATP-binding protein [Streptosporangium becharense]MBB5823288.1 ABC-2 type transport system ATP-binding protein [Streptosporangium becharense]
MADVAVETSGLRKTYVSSSGVTEAVAGLTLQVPKGELFGLLGPNGAGKSTTIGMLTTRIVPTDGVARVAGADVVRDPIAVKRRIGVVAQYNNLDRQLTVLENLEFRGRYAGLPAKEARRRALELLERFSLGSRAGARVTEMSGGQAQRVMIARALIHRPDVLFLDEPTSGLDPQTRVNLWDILDGIRAAGQTVVLSTHYMEEAERLCDRIAIVDHGAVLACGPLPELKASAALETVLTLTYDEDPEKIVEQARRLGGVRGAEVSDTRLRVLTQAPEGILADLVRLSQEAGLTLTDVRVVRPSLETVFLTLTGREYRE